MNAPTRPNAYEIRSVHIALAIKRAVERATIERDSKEAKNA